MRCTPGHHQRTTDKEEKSHTRNSAAATFINLNRHAASFRVKKLQTPVSLTHACIIYTRVFPLYPSISIWLRVTNSNLVYSNQKQIWKITPHNSYSQSWHLNTSAFIQPSAQYRPVNYATNPCIEAGTRQDVGIFVWLMTEMTVIIMNTFSIDGLSLLQIKLDRAIYWFHGRRLYSILS